MVCVFSSVSDADGSEGGFQLKKEHALRVLGYISSWSQRSVFLLLAESDRFCREASIKKGGKSVLKMKRM